MKINEYLIMQDCVEEGVHTGWNLAHKRTDTPSEHDIRDAIMDAVILRICEYFSFREYKDE